MIFIYWRLLVLTHTRTFEIKRHMVVQYYSFRTRFGAINAHTHTKRCLTKRAFISYAASTVKQTTISSVETQVDECPYSVLSAFSRHRNQYECKRFEYAPLDRARKTLELNNYADTQIWRKGESDSIQYVLRFVTRRKETKYQIHIQIHATEKYSRLPEENLWFTVNIEFDSDRRLSSHSKRHHIRVKWFELVGRKVKLLNIFFFFDDITRREEKKVSFFFWSSQFLEFYQQIAGNKNIDIQLQLTPN